MNKINCLAIINGEAYTCEYVNLTDGYTVFAKTFQ